MAISIMVFFWIIVVFAIIYGIGGIDRSIREQGYNDGYEKVDQITEADKGTGKITFVIAGVDKIAGATDTIMIGCYDFDKNEVNIISVPRDTRVKIGGKFQKINSAYGIKGKNGLKKGMNGTIEAVKKLTGVQEVNHYIEFNLNAFRDTVDALGGVQFNVPRNMFYEDPEQGLYINLKKGDQLLNGNKAEQLVRYRSYPMGDIDRIKVQQAFLKALADQHFNVGLVTKVPDLFNVVKENIVTDLVVEDVLKYAYNVKDLKSENIHMYNLPGFADDVTYGGSYWLADISEVKKLVKDKLGCDASTATDGSDGKHQRPKATPTPEPSESPEPTSSAKPSSTKKPTTSPKPTTTPKTSEKPEEEDKPIESESPKTSDEGFKRPSAN